MLQILWKIIRFPIRHYLISGAIFGYWICTANGGTFEFDLWLFSLGLYCIFTAPFGNRMRRADVRKKEMDYFAHKLAEENAKAQWGGQSSGQQYGQSDYWLDKAQAKQEIRFKNSLPPLKEEARPQKKTFREKWNESRGLSPTGWKFNEETQLWESPEQQKMKK